MSHDTQIIELGLRGRSTPTPVPAPMPVVSAPAPQSCIETCPELAARSAAFEQARLEDIATVAAVVQDTIASLGHEMYAWHGDISATTGRLDALVSLPDPVQLRSRLLEEVKTLKATALEHRQRWESTTREYAERVATLEEQLQSTRAEALSDGLTGLANRRAFDRELNKRLRSPRECVVLALLDLDNFKGLNDARGHAVGDSALAGVARTLEDQLRPMDFVARLGGDEFAVIVAGLSLRQSELRFTQIVHDISARVHGVSCGLAEFSAGDTGQSLYDRADSALYDAKRAGKGRVAARHQVYLRDLRAR
jgi:diguanylate cyclase